MPTMSSCSQCGRTFPNSQALLQHRSSKHRHNCQKCDRSFMTAMSLADHKRGRHGPPPPKATKSSAKSQMGPPKKEDANRYCGECRKFFPNPNALRQHLLSATHASEFRCCDCERNFVSTQALMRHLQDKVHKPKPAPVLERSPPTCDECKRQFRTEEALRQHRSSGIHLPRTFPCAAGGCDSRFGSAAGMLQHLESGSCSSGMDRQELHNLVLRSDPEGLISSPRGNVQHLLEEAKHQLVREIEDGNYMSFTDVDDAVSLRSRSSSTSEVILTPSSTMISSSLASPILTPTSSCASTALMMPTKGNTRCPLCPPTRRAFSTSKALEQHLQSAAHDARIFHCPIPPLAFTEMGVQGKAAVKWFSTVSSMAQHVESGACSTSGLGFGKILTNLEARVMELGLSTGRVICSS
ncbi:hypothetical protein B0T14DRAFT_197994 [Immersiella caudata]|uniref:C2H2-type domain-containing protein n=1 Tax=Immersiella caudata TaxID=314043 RepID=A0AA39WP32_9PEZI|nr:hypothetical protein B0T14DRAFT_197994 [Immersiella caudata]